MDEKILKYCICLSYKTPFFKLIFIHFYQRLTRKKIILLFVSISLLVPIHSQHKFGIDAGIGQSNYRGKDFSGESSPKQGLIAGLYFERELNMTLSLGFELNYEKKGTDYNYYPRIATNINTDSRLEYLTLPVLLKFYIGKNANFYFYPGVSGSYLINSSNNVRATEYGYEIAWEPFFTYQFRKLDASLLIGFGFNVHEVILDFRYHHGIIDIYKGSNTPSIKNSFFSVTLGYSIYKKRVDYCFNPGRKH